VSDPPAGDVWLHEVKFDGYRCQLHKAGDDVVIFSRNGRDFTNRLPGIRDAVLTLPCKSAVIDGEVVVCKEDGTPDFRALHSGNYTQEILCVWAFDLMELNGEDLRPFPLVARKRKLGTILRRHDHPMCVTPSRSKAVGSYSLSAASAGSKVSSPSESTRRTSRASVTG
jgi:bifunctional non-homologous end joining protein LigD